MDIDASILFAWHNLYSACKTTRDNSQVVNATTRAAFPLAYKGSELGDQHLIQMGRHGNGSDKIQSHSVEDRRER